MLEPRHHKDIAWYDEHTGKSKTLGQFAKEFSIEIASFDNYNPNLIKYLYSHIKTTLMRLVPARYYHKRRENRINRGIEKLITSISPNSSVS